MNEKDSLLHLIPHMSRTWSQYRAARIGNFFHTVLNILNYIYTTI